MSYPTDSSTQFDYTTLSILPTFSSVTNPTILFNDGTSGILLIINLLSFVRVFYM